MTITVPKQNRGQVARLPIRIDGPRAIELLLAVVAQTGADHVYDGPLFHDEFTSDPGEDGCPRLVDEHGQGADLIGRALILAGVPAAELAKHEGSNAFDLIDVLASDRLVTHDWEAVTALQIAQEAQDAGRPWGRAVAEARAALAETAPEAPARPRVHLAHDHLTTAQGVADALLALHTTEATLQLPHPVDAHPIAQLGRFDVQFESPAQLAAWADALHIPVVEDGHVRHFHTFLGGHYYDLWALARSEATR